MYMENRFIRADDVAQELNVSDNEVRLTKPDFLFIMI